MTTSGRKPKGRGFERREEIILAAETLFERRGFDTPLRDIAAAAGLSQASLFKHFANRAELTSAVRDEIYARMEAEIREERASSEGIRANLEAVLRVYARLAKERPSIFSLAFPSAAQMAQLGPNRVSDVASLPGLTSLQAALRLGSKSRLLSLDLVSLSSWFMIYGMALTVAVEFGRDRVKAEEVIATLVDLLAAQIFGFG